MSDLLNERIELLSRTRRVAEFDMRALDFGNIEKLGYPIEIRSKGASAVFFVPRSHDREGLFGYEGFAFVFGLDPTLFQALEGQNFSLLLGFRLSNLSVFQPNIAANVSEDGTTFAAIPMEQLQEIVSA